MLGTLAALLVIGSAPQDVTYDSRRFTQPFRTMEEATLILEMGNLLMSGSAGQNEVKRLVRQGSSAKRKAAAIVLLDAHHVQYLPTLLSLADDKELNSVAGDAIQINPKAALPLLIKMARDGSVGALSLIPHFRPYQKATIAEFTRHGRPEVRIRALELLNSSQHFETAIEDKNHLVVRAAVQGLLGRREYDKKKLYFHKRARIRANAAELTDPHAFIDYDLWARIAKDPNPEVKYWAMTRLSRLPQRHGGHAESVEAVRLGIVNGPAEVREVATFTMRGWLYSWDDAVENWSSENVRAVRGIMKLKQFRDELYRQETVELKEWINTIFASRPIDAGVALAMTGDGRAGDLLLKAITANTSHASNELEKHIEALAYIKKTQAREILHRIVYSAMRRPSQPADSGDDYEATVALMAAMEALSKTGAPVEAERFATISKNRRIDYRLRDAFVQALGYLDNPVTLEAIIDIANDETEIPSVRYNALFGLALNPSRRALDAAIALKNHADKSIAMNARIAEEQWLKKFGTGSK